MHKTRLTGILLAGGTSKRMERDKATCIYKGKVLMDYSYDLMLKTCDEIFIVSNDKSHIRDNAKLVADRYSDAGPLSGILSGLLASSYETNLVLPCDSPNINADLISNLISKRDDKEVILPSYKGKLHPVIGIYSKSIIDKLDTYLKDGNRKMLPFIKECSHIVLDCSEFDASVFANINTPSDLKS